MKFTNYILPGADPRPYRFSPHDAAMARFSANTTDMKGLDSHVAVIHHFADTYDYGRPDLPNGLPELLATMNSDVRTLARKKIPTFRFFSGDVFASGLHSHHFLGANMIPALNRFGFDAMVFGNQDINDGIPASYERLKQLKFPVVATNLANPQTGEPFPGTVHSHIVEKMGVRIGIVGLIDKSWFTEQLTVPLDPAWVRRDEDVLPKHAIHFLEAGCHYMVALTHKDWVSDLQLAQKHRYLTLICGGHDHDPMQAQEHGLVKAGSDATRYSATLLARGSHDALGRQTYLKPNDGIHGADKILKRLERDFAAQYRKAYPDQKFLMRILPQYVVTKNQMRTQETLMGNLVTDALLWSAQKLLGNSVQAAVVNAGNLRSNTIFPNTDFTTLTLKQFLYHNEFLVVAKIPGRILRQIFEVGLEQVNQQSGRFLQVSGMSYSYSGSEPEFHRVGEFKINGQDVEDDQIYEIAMEEFLLSGADGYTLVKDAYDRGDIEIIVGPSQDTPKTEQMIQSFLEYLASQKMTYMDYFNVNRTGPRIERE